MWHAKEATRELYSHDDPDLARQWIDRLIIDMADRDNPVEVRSLGRTLKRWKEQIIAWHRAKVTNGPTEAANNLIKRVSALPSGSDRSVTTESGHCSTPASPTGTCSLPSHPAEIRRTTKVRMS